MEETARGRVVGVLANRQAVNSVVDRLELGGFDHAQFGALAPEDALKGRSSSDVAKDRSSRSGALLDEESRGALEGGFFGGGVYLGVFLGSALVAGGAAVALAGALGGLVGALIAHGFHRKHAEDIQDQLARGGLVLWILTRDAKQEDEAVEALRNAAAKDISVQVSLKLNNR